MKEAYIGICASVALHVCAFLLFLGLSGALQKSTETVLVDFTLVKEEEGTVTTVLGPGDEEQGKKAGAGPKKAYKGERRTNREIRDQSGFNSPVTRMEDSNLTVLRPAIRIPTDPLGNVTIQGETGTPVAHTHSDGGSPGMPKDGIPGAAGGSGHRGQGSGSGGTGLLRSGKDFDYIRDTVIRNIRYPEKARRIGAEGKVLLSFIVLENGSTGNVKVIKGSGFSLLDESAKEAVMRTTIQRKVPHRVVVLLPIVYELH